MAAYHLVIFVKNPIPGTVKTRIAKTVGAEKAAEVYRHLVQHTQQVTHYGSWTKVVYYADFVNPNDGWNGYQKAQQTGGDLGQRMEQAFRDQFAAGAEKTVLIGSDCLAITEAHLAQAFTALSKADVVIGPASDGGYYLLAMKQIQPQLFAHMPWSQSNLLTKTEQVIQQSGLTYTYLDTLTDIDEWDDYLAATSQAS